MTPAAILSIFGRETIRLLATPSYELATPIIPLLCFGAICWGAGYILGIGTSIAKKSYHTTIATVIGAAINISLNFLLIPRWGIAGAASAILVGNLACMIYRHLSSQRYYPIHYNRNHLFSIVTITGLASFTGIIADRWFTDWNAWSIVVKIVLCILPLSSLFLLRIISKSEIDSVSQLIKRIAQTAISSFNLPTYDPVDELKKE
jgi:O-antigen/teichoic acid export membrane protein